MKYREGQHNKVFQLTMDNRAEVAVKIPNPNAGPACYTTASEVATMDYVCYYLVGLDSMADFQASKYPESSSSQRTWMEPNVNERYWF
jgi:hypothetical protein